MKKSICLFSVLIMALLLACSDEGGYSDSIVAPSSMGIPFRIDSVDKNLVRIKSTGLYTYLGTDETSAKINERPLMKVNFDYDFSISYHEVTCEEFNELPKESSLSNLKLDCENKNFPVTNVTYYDAILFANEKSKQKGVDTAYTFESAFFDDDGNCTELEGLKFLPEVEGYRLPTEAEWTLVANQGWRPLLSWNASNSDYKKHEICTKPENNVTVCDMAGNVMEWVNDWLGDFRDTIMANYIGPAQSSSLGERILKGGSFRNESSAMHVYNRNDVYVVTSSTKSDYVGFRLAFGKIPDATMMYGDGNSEASQITVKANSSVMRNLTGTYKTKLAFRNDVTGNLAYVDYSYGNLTVTEIHDEMNVYHPDISPDGKHVAFCTGAEGVGGKSELYVRDLDIYGSNLVKLEVDSAAIPRWRVLPNGDTVIVYVSDSGNNKKESSFLKKSTWQVSFAQGRFGTPQKIYDGAYHGGVSEDNHLAVTGARLLRARNNDNNVVWYDGDQACNVSLAKDGSNRTLFLDFGGKLGRDFAKTKYGVHEMLLVADSTGKLVRAVPSPSGYAFDHTEWATSLNNSYVVATLTNENGAHTKVVLLNLADSSATTLVEGTEVWHPCLWSMTESYKKDSKLDADSAGMYMNSNDPWGPIIMRYKMELLWRYRDDVKVAILGSSRPLYSISPSYFDDSLFAVNFAHTPNSIYASRDYLNSYLFDNLKNLKYVVVSLDLDFWNKVDGKSGDNFFVVDFDRYPGYVYDRNHGYWKDSYPQGLLELTENSLGSEYGNLYTDDRGRFTGTVCGSWGDVPEVEGDSTLFDSNPQLIENAFAALEEILKEAKSRGVTVVGMIFPQNPRYRETGAFGRYGMRRSTAETLLARFKKLGDKYPNFVLFDENKMGAHDYTDDMAVDADHLCYAGVEKISVRLVNLLRSL